MSCNSCSNITLPGVQGPQGPAGSAGQNGTDGNGFTGGSYDSGTGVVTFTSDDGLGFSTSDLRGADGTDGMSLLHAITSAGSDVTSTSYVDAITIPNVAANTLSTNLDTIRMEGVVLNTLGDVSQGLDIQITSTTSGTDTLTLGVISQDFLLTGTLGIKFKIDIIRVSNTQVKIEANCEGLLNQGIMPGVNYASNYVLGYTPFPVLHSNQTISSMDLASDALDIDLRLKTSNASFPTKVSEFKMFLIKKQ